MLTQLKKIWFDTTTGPDGKYSRKSLTTLICLSVAIELAIVDTAGWGKVNVDIFFGFLTLGGGTLAMTVWDKVKPKAE